MHPIDDPNNSGVKSSKVYRKIISSIFHFLIEI